MAPQQVVSQNNTAARRQQCTGRDPGCPDHHISVLLLPQRVSCRSFDFARQCSATSLKFSHLGLTSHPSTGFCPITFPATNDVGRVPEGREARLFDRCEVRRRRRAQKVEQWRRCGRNGTFVRLALWCSLPAAFCPQWPGNCFETNCFETNCFETSALWGVFFLASLWRVEQGRADH